MRIVNDPAMEYCPQCYDDGAIVRLVKTKLGGFCPHHGQITEIRQSEARDRKISKPSTQPPTERDTLLAGRKSTLSPPPVT